MLSQHRYTKIMLFLPYNDNFSNNIVVSIYLNCWNWHFRCSVFRPIMVSYYGFGITLEKWNDINAENENIVDLVISSSSICVFVCCYRVFCWKFILWWMENFYYCLTLRANTKCMVCMYTSDICVKIILSLRLKIYL